MATQNNDYALPQVEVVGGRGRSVMLRHPWLFRSALVEQSLQGRGVTHGAVVQVCDGQGTPGALGFYSETSQIAVRLFEFDAVEHRPSEAYWLEKLNRAARLRATVLKRSPDTNCYRLCQAEGDFLPGLIIDVYNQVAVLQVGIAGMERLLPLVSEWLTANGFPMQYLRDTDTRKRERLSLQGNRWLTAPATEEIRCLENGMHFAVDVAEGQKTGFFLDQRDNRALVQQYAAGRRVLNAFAYTGGFSVAALLGGAEKAHSVDISAPATAMAVHNAELNGVAERHEATTADCFAFLTDLHADMPKTGSPYDLIILDPPAFAKTKDTASRAARGYKEINMKALKLLPAGGLLFTFSCSQAVDEKLFRQIVFSAATDVGRNVRVLHTLQQAPCHPASLAHPEGEYLKGLALYVE